MKMIMTIVYIIIQIVVVCNFIGIKLCMLKGSWDD